MDKKEHERLLSRERNRKYRADMTPEQKKKKYFRDKINREKKKAERLLLNESLFKEGKRICSRCFNKKLLSEFSTKGIQPNNYNNICDFCLIKINKTKVKYSEFMTEAFWRNKAYSANKTAIARFKRLGICQDIQKLEYKATGLDMLSLYNNQDGKCFYCSGDLSELDISIDHKIPLSKQGKHICINLCLCCKDCNFLKGSRNEEEFRSFLKEYYLRLSEVIEL